MKIHTKPVKKPSPLTRFARRIPARATWEKLTLPERQLVALRKIIHQVNQLPGNGCRGLLSGPTSNHKMMAAQVVARELKRPLYQINLESIVSKYIGQTEKNISALFDAAEHADAILVFDEADALFGKRTQVRDAHDRYSNKEVGYLLSAVNQYTGLILVTATQKNNLDQAFTRRLRHVIVFK